MPQLCNVGQVCQLVESCGFTCEQTLFSKESLALPTSGFVLSEGGLVRASDLIVQNSFVFCPFSSSSAAALRSRHRLITQSSLSQQQWGVSLKYLALRKATALLWELWAFVCNCAFIPKALLWPVQCHRALSFLSEPVAAGKNFQKAFVWKPLQFFFFGYLKAVGSPGVLCQLKWSPMVGYREGFTLFWSCSHLELVLREAEGEEGQSASTDSTADLREAPGWEGKWAGRSVTDCWLIGGSAGLQHNRNSALLKSSRPCSSCSEWLQVV